jgi:hypothetical protein
LKSGNSGRGLCFAKAGFKKKNIAPAVREVQLFFIIVVISSTGPMKTRYGYRRTDSVRRFSVSFAFPFWSIV